MGYVTALINYSRCSSLAGELGLACPLSDGHDPGPSFECPEL
jgi:hypothetical protein